MLAGLECRETADDDWTFFGGTYIGDTAEPMQITLVDNQTFADTITIHMDVVEWDYGPTFICGNGDEIPFDWVNDGYEDCSDGSPLPLT